MRSLIVCLSLLASPAMAQNEQSAAGGSAFTGPYAGLELGAHEHHFFLVETHSATGQTRGRYYRGWGIGGGAFAGVDLAVLPRVRAGLEVGLSVGGNNPVARYSDGTVYTQHPRYGYRATTKLGYLVRDDLLAYGTLGYGGHRYRLGGNMQVEGARGSGSSFTIGAGLQHRLSSRVDVRVDFRHLDNQMSHLLIGVPMRF